MAPAFIAAAGLLSAGRNHRHGREVFVMLAVCLACAVLGALGEMA